jgi:diguanylate cyclase
VKLFGRSPFGNAENEIGSGKSSPEALRAEQFVELGKALLTLLQQYRWEIEELKSARFLRDLEEWKNGLTDLRSPQSIDQTRRKIYERANEHLKKEKTYLEEREQELKKMIGLLSEAVSTVTEGSGSYHQELWQTTTQLTQISQLEDIRKMRSMLASEIQHLKETVRQKQSQEKEQYDLLSRHVEALQSKLQTAVNRSLLDSLTGLYNRQGWDQELYNACQSASVTHVPFAVALVDVDNFKHINDEYGHQVGDLVLTELAKAFKDSFRPEDVIARYGGDEIAFILRTPSLDKAEKRMGRLVKEIAKPTYCCTVDGRNHYLKLSISCGVGFCRKEDTPETVVRRVDEALYIAKKNGKNQVATETNSAEGGTGMESLVE